MRFTKSSKVLLILTMILMNHFIYSFEVTKITRRSLLGFNKKGKGKKSKFSSKNSSHNGSKKVQVRITKKTKYRRSSGSSSTALSKIKKGKRKIKKVGLFTKRSQKSEIKKKEKSKFFLASLVVLFVIFLVYASIKIGNAIFRNTFLYPLQRENLKNVTKAIQEIYEMRMDSCSFNSIKVIKQRRMNIALIMKIVTYVTNMDTKCGGCNEPKSKECEDYCMLRNTLEHAKKAANEALNKEVDQNEVCGWQKTEDGLTKMKTKYENLVENQANVWATIRDVTMNVLWSLSTYFGEVGNSVKDSVIKMFGKSVKHSNASSIANKAAYVIDEYQKVTGLLNEDDFWVKIFPIFQLLCSVISGIAPFFGDAGGKLANITTIANNTIDLVTRIIGWIKNWKNIPWCERILEISGAIVSLRWIVPEIFSFIGMSRVAATLGLSLDALAALIEMGSTACYFVEAALIDPIKIKNLYQKSMKEASEGMCNSDINLMKDAVNKEEVMNLMEIEQGDISKIRKDLANYCQYSLLFCLNVDAKMKTEEERLFTKEEFKKYYDIIQEGPINDIAISSTYQYDDQFTQLGYEPMFRTYQNMNALYLCRGCNPNIIITYVCLESSETDPTTSKCYFDKENLKTKTLRITYDKILVFAVRTLKGQGEKVRFLRRISIDQEGRDITLNTEYGCLNFKESDSIVDYEINDRKLQDEDLTNSEGNILATSTINSTSDYEEVQKGFCKRNCVGDQPKPSLQCIRMYSPMELRKNRMKKFRYGFHKVFYKLKTEEQKTDAQKAVENVQKFTMQCSNCPEENVPRYYIRKGEYLRGKDDAIYSLNEKFKAEMLENGDLVIKDLDDKSNIVWKKRSKKKGAYAEVDALGHFKISQDNSKNIATFRTSKRCEHTDCRLVLSDWGVLEMIDWSSYKVLWQSDNIVKTFMEVGDYLENSNNSFFSPNKKYFATVKDTGEFGIWNMDDKDGPPKWSTNTKTHARARLTLEEDGNLVLKGINKNVIWQSDTSLEELAKYRLILTNDPELKLVHPQTHEAIKTLF